MKRVFLGVLAALVVLVAPAAAASGTSKKASTIDMERYAPDTIVVHTTGFRLYYKMQSGEVVSYEIGVGREGMTWSGQVAVGAKKKWPDWTPPQAMLERQPYLPRHISSGLKSPLGARALYLYEGKEQTLYRIHGTDDPNSIGKAATSGCFRMHNEDVVELYTMVRIGTKVIVLE